MPIRLKVNFFFLYCQRQTQLQQKKKTIPIQRDFLSGLYGGATSAFPPAASSLSGLLCAILLLPLIHLAPCEGWLLHERGGESPCASPRARAGDCKFVLPPRIQPVQRAAHAALRGKERGPRLSGPSRYGSCPTFRGASAGRVERPSQIP